MSRGRGLLARLLSRHRESAGAGVSDTELLRRFSRERDEAAFELLVWRYGEMVLGVCRRATHDEQHAEDAFQAVFLVLARKAGAVRGNLGGWLFKVARRVSARVASRRVASEPLCDVASEVIPDRAEQKELAELLDAEVSRLPERLRKPVVLCYLGGRSTDDAARELGCPRGTVLSRLATARARLADRLVRRGVTAPLVLVAGSAALTARTVSAAVQSANTFRSGAHAATPATVLAEGVLQTMTRGTLLVTLGSAALAVTLVGGVGWVAAQPGTKVAPAPGGDVPAARPIAELVAANAPPARGDGDDKKQQDEHLRKLEKVADGLRSEIELSEQKIELFAKAAQKDASVQKRLANAEEELQRSARELAKMEAELAVLKKRLDAKPAPDPDPVVVKQIIAQDARVIRSRELLARTRDGLAKAVSQSTAPDTDPGIQAFKADLAKREQEVAAAEKQALDEALTVVRAAEQKVFRERIEKLKLDIEIQKEVRESLRIERDSLAKLVAQQAGGAQNVEAMRKQLDPQREALAKVKAEILALRIQQQGGPAPRADNTDAKLDLLLREIAELRKEVRELKNKK